MCPLLSGPRCSINQLPFSTGLVSGPFPGLPTMLRFGIGRLAGSLVAALPLLRLRLLCSLKATTMGTRSVMQREQILTCTHSLPAFVLPGPLRHLSPPQTWDPRRSAVSRGGSETAARSLTVVDLDRQARMKNLNSFTGCHRVPVSH